MATPGLMPRSLDASTRPAERGAARPAPRLGWLDLSRGLVVVAVVLMHVSYFHHAALLDGAGADITGAWALVNDKIAAVRMPILLVLSGMLAASKMAAGLGSSRTRTAIVTNAWLYVVWLALYALLTVVAGSDIPNAVPSGSAYLEQLLRPDTSLWFIAALVWFQVCFALLRRLGPVTLVATTFGLGFVAHHALNGVPGIWTTIPQLAVYFAIGLTSRNAMPRLVHEPRYAVAGAFFVLATEQFGLRELPWAAYPVSVLYALSGMAVVVTVVALVDRNVERVAAPGRWLGKHTLAIYVMHFPLVVLATAGARSIDGFGATLAAVPVLAWTYPLLATALVVWACLRLEHLLRRARLTWLFDAPAPVKSLVGEDVAGWLRGLAISGRGHLGSTAREMGRAWTTV